MRTFPLSWSIALSATLLTACASDDFSSPPTTTTAGQGGTAGASGGSGQAGAGQSGVGGSGGGNAGSSPGGSAGQAGSGGAGAAGAGAAGAGAAGSSGGGQGGAPACKPNTYKCVENTLYICANDGSYKAEQTCDPKVCDEKVGKCKLCTPGEVLGCASKQSQSVCSASGDKGTPQVCPSQTPFCQSPGECVQCLADSDCKPTTECKVGVCNAGVCDEQDAPEGTLSSKPAASECTERRCKSNGTAQDEPLAVGTPCNSSAGVCNGSGECGVCQPGSVQCGDGGSTRTCLPSGQWDVAMLCPEEKPACSAGACLGVAKVVSGTNHNCALLTNNTVRCWGSNKSHNLGLGAQSTAPQFTPTEVPGLKNIVDISAGEDHSCALDKDGSLSCWGSNFKGQLGLGIEDQGKAVSSPTMVTSDEFLIKIFGHLNHSCAIAKSGKLMCWGDNEFNQSCQGSDSFYASPCPIQPSVLSNVKTAMVSRAHTCAVNVTPGGSSTYCWGANDSSQIGQGAGVTSVSVTSPKMVPGANELDELFGGGDASYGWGDETSSKGDIIPSRFIGWGQCQQGETYNSSGVAGDCKGELTLYSFAKNGRPFAAVRAFCHTNIYPKLQQLTVSGDCDANFLPTNGTYSLPMVAGSSVGKYHVCAWQKGGKVWCFGDNSFGQIGQPMATPKLTDPTPVKW